MSKQHDFDKLDLLGIGIDAVSNSDAIDYICARATAGQPACYVVKPYVEFLDRAYHNETLRDLLNGSELALPDGVALTWAAAYLYAGRRTSWRLLATLSQIVFDPGALRWPLPDRTAGINFTWPLLERARDHQLGVYLIGKESKDDIEQVAELITRKLPGIKIVGTMSGREEYSPYRQVSNAWLEQAAVSLRHANADLVLVGMGFPLQERVCAYLAGHTPHGVYIGEGGTFDFDSFGGPRRKAPAWMQRSGLEWLWRLILEPRRIVRQLAIPRFIYRIWRTR
jgi:N-acetylglucosaminyldiphosphoundecaprenol N-acetyl-beta-D-mannosaminyltransferase